MRDSSRCWDWSSPTGTWVALRKAIRFDALKSFGRRGSDIPMDEDVRSLENRI